MSLTLAELEAEFARVEGDGPPQGLRFLCPVCFQKNGGRVGTHSVICWFSDAGVPSDQKPGPGRWDVIGQRTDPKTLTLSPSVENPCWHGFVEGGSIRTA